MIQWAIVGLQVLALCAIAATLARKPPTDDEVKEEFLRRYYDGAYKRRGEKNE